MEAPFSIDFVFDDVSYQGRVHPKRSTEDILYRVEYTPAGHWDTFFTVEIYPEESGEGDDQLIWVQKMAVGEEEIIHPIPVQVIGEAIERAEI